MMIDLTYGGIISIVIFLAFLLFFGWLLTKKFPRIGKSPGGAALLSAIPAGIICFPLFLLYNNPVHVIDKWYGGRSYMLIGSANYDLGEGRSETIPFKWATTRVVNQSDQALVVEDVYYGYGNTVSPQAFPEVAAHSIGEVGQIDYYPEQAPPQALELKSGDRHSY